MKLRSLILVLGVSLGLACGALGFSNDGSSVSLEVERAIALTNSAVQVTATFTNAGSNVLRGFFYTAQVPDAFSVAPVAVTINGQGITNYTLESGQSGDVYPGCAPWRWRLETPTNFPEANPVPPQALVQFIYSLAGSLPGRFALQSCDWAEYWPESNNSTFGYSETADLCALSVLVTTNQPVLSGQVSTNGYLVSVLGDVGASYVLETSSDLLAWVPLLTNSLPFTLADTNRAAFGSRFYRAWVFPGNP